MNHLNEALRLAELGWHVFALGPTGHPYPNCKLCRETCTIAQNYEACDHLICHATYAGTTDSARLEAMWHHFPQSLIGIRTGAPSGLVVLDFDMHSEAKNGQQSFDRLSAEGVLTQTVAAETGGGGLHLYYQHPGIPVLNDNRGKLASGVDVKGDGGFVIAAPSAKRGKLPYSWILDPWSSPVTLLPDTALHAITKSDDKPIKFLPGQTTDSNDLVMTKWENSLDQLRFAGVGGRNENLYRAACRGGEVIASGQLSNQQVIDLLEDAGRDSGLTPSEIRQTIRSGLTRGHHDYSSQEES